MSDLHDHRDHLFGLAYRMLGSIADAEDVVQDAWVRWLRREQTTDVRSVRAFLTTTATRLSIDRLRALKTQREGYRGMWLAEPVIEFGLEPQTARAESLSPAFMVVLETLTAVERAVFLLREVFDLGYDEIAPIVDKTESNCRQIASRARQHVGDSPRFDAEEAAATELAMRFFAATVSGDMTDLLAVLRSDVVAWSDHGGKASAAQNTIRGADAVSRYFVGASAKFGAGKQPVLARVSGVPGLVLYDGDGVYAVLFVEVSDDRIARIGTFRNPDKLLRVPPAP